MKTTTKTASLPRPTLYPLVITMGMRHAAYRPANVMAIIRNPKPETVALRNRERPFRVMNQQARLAACRKAQA
jgi:hypothetical protein